MGGVEIPMVGRDLEKRRLLSIIERAESESRAEVALISGPPGIGKTRLCAEVRPPVSYNFV